MYDMIFGKVHGVARQGLLFFDCGVQATQRLKREALFYEKKLSAFFIFAKPVKYDDCAVMYAHKELIRRRRFFGRSKCFHQLSVKVYERTRHIIRKLFFPVWITD